MTAAVPPPGDGAPEGGLRRLRRLAAVAGIATLTIPVGGVPPGLPPAPPVRNAIELISRGGGPGASSQPDLARDKPEVAAFSSAVDDLVPGDGNGLVDAFVNDNGRIERISDDLPGQHFTGLVAGPAISGSGDVVGYCGGFRGDGEAAPIIDRVVVVDRRTGAVDLAPEAADSPTSPTCLDVAISPDGTTVVWVGDGDVWAYGIGSDTPGPVLVSCDPAGNRAGGASTVAVSNNGAAIVFVSDRAGLVPDDTNGVADVFLRRDALTAAPGDCRVTRVSHPPGGGDPDGPSTDATITPGGETVAFTSQATNLVPGDDNATSDVFVADVATGTIRAVTEGNGPSGEPSLSDDGREVAFASAADDIVPGDTNGPDPRSLTPTNFSVIARDGRITYGTKILAVDGPRVRVGFPVDISSSVAAAVAGRALVDGQTRPLDPPDGRSNTNPPGTVRLARAGGRPAGSAPGPDLTAGPDLVSATVAVDDNRTPTDPADDVRAVRFCFDEPLAGIRGTAEAPGSRWLTTAAFTMIGYNSAARRSSTRARAADDDPACLLAGFGMTVDPARFTVAVAGAGAVADAGGRTNLELTRPLSGATLAPQPGDVTGPNLRSVTPESTTNRARFTFDAIAGTNGAPADAGTAARFTFLDADGRPHPGQAIVAVDASSVTVQFAADTDPLNNARRFVVPAGTVLNSAGEGNVDQATDGDVAGPELTAVSRVSDAVPAQYDFTFNVAVAGPDPARLRVVTADGTVFPAASVAQPRPTVVRATVPDVDSFAASIVRGIAARGAVVGGGGGGGSEAAAVTGRLSAAPGPAAVSPRSGPENTPGTKAVSSANMASGTTDGPDLLDAVMGKPDDDADPKVVSVLYSFDASVEGEQLTGSEPDLSGAGTDVFVTDLTTGRVVLASTESDGSEAAGASLDPSLSGDGGKVGFASTGPLTGDTDGSADVYSRNLLQAQPDAAAIDFGSWPVGQSAPAARPLLVANRGLGPMAIDHVRLAGAEAGDFALTSDGCTGTTLEPDQTCPVSVSFTPAAAGRRTARLVFTDNAPGSPRAVRLSGAGTVPTVRLSPGVGPPGAVALVSGSGFPPGTRIELRWVRNVSHPVGPEPVAETTTVVADETGQFSRAPFLVLPGDVEGPRTLEAGSADGRITVYTPFLVVAGTYAPSGSDPSGVPFLTRQR